MHTVLQPSSMAVRKIAVIGMLRSRMAAIKAGRYYRLYLEQWQNYGKTWEESLAGTKVVNSMEPANFLQVASLSFQDYGKLAVRIKALSLRPGRKAAIHNLI